MPLRLSIAMALCMPGPFVALLSRMRSAGWPSFDDRAGYRSQVAVQVAHIIVRPNVDIRHEFNKGEGRTGTEGQRA